MFKLIKRENETLGRQKHFKTGGNSKFERKKRGGGEWGAVICFKKLQPPNDPNAWHNIPVSMFNETV